MVRLRFIPVSPGSKKWTRRRSTYIVATEPLEAGLFGAAAATAAVAPEAAASGPRTVKNRLTEEIVVTAEKREENLQEVPASVAAFSGAALDAKAVEAKRSLMGEA